MVKDARSISLHVVACVLLATVTGHSHAETIFWNIEIKLVDSCLAAQGTISVVINGRGEPVTPNVVTPWPRPLTKDAHASFRWDSKTGLSMRSACAKADSPPLHSVLTFHFRECHPANNVTILADTGDNVRSQASYLRRLEFGDLPCPDETEPFYRRKELNAVDLDDETLLLRLAKGTPDLSVNEWHRLVSGEKPVTRDKVGHLLSVQQAQGRVGTPTYSSNAYDLTVTNLRAAKFKSVTIKVH